MHETRPGIENFGRMLLSALTLAVLFYGLVAVAVIVAHWLSNGHA